MNIRKLHNTTSLNSYRRQHLQNLLRQNSATLRHYEVHCRPGYKPNNTLELPVSDFDDWTSDTAYAIHYNAVQNVQITPTPVPAKYKYNFHRWGCSSILSFNFPIILRKNIPIKVSIYAAIKATVPRMHAECWHINHSTVDPALPPLG